MCCNRMPTFSNCNTTELVGRFSIFLSKTAISPSIEEVLSSMQIEYSRPSKVFNICIQIMTKKYEIIPSFNYYMNIYTKKFSNSTLREEFSIKACRSSPFRVISFSLKDFNYCFR